MNAMRWASLDHLLAPRSVAIIGASRNPVRIGGRPIAHLIGVGFPGPVYPINPASDEVQGLRAYKAIGDVPGPVDCAVISLPAGEVLDQVRACCGAGVKSIVIFSAGFSELGEAGTALQAELTRLARAHGVRVLGPNCVGFFNATARAPLTFISTVPKAIVPGRNLGVVTQSGGYGTHIQHIAAKRGGISLGHWITTGNEADLEFGEALEWLAHQDEVDVIVGYMEGLRSTAALIRGLEAAARQRKPVIVMKVGATDEGALAAASHTASLAGVDAAYAAAFERYGVYRAHSTDEVIDVARACLARRFPRQNTVCVFTNSGGLGVQMADYASERGLALPPIGPEVQAKFLAMVPYGSARNPVDVTAQIMNEPDLLGRSLEMAFEEGGFSVAVVYLGPGAKLPAIQEPLFTAVEAVARKYSDRTIVLSIVAPDELVMRYEELGCIVCDEPADAIRAVAALWAIERGWQDIAARHGASSADADVPRLAGRRLDTEAAGKQFLAECGIPVPAETLARTPEEAAQAASRIAGPVAIKIVSPDIAHKTEVGGVALGLATPDQARTAAVEMGLRVAAQRPDARIDGFLVTTMYSGGVECILGMKRDPVFGAIVMVGLGGIAVEVIKDVRWALAPVTAGQALAMIRGLKTFALLDGYRGRPRADIPALAEAVSRFSAMAAANVDELDGAEINPLLVLEEGRGAVALDALFTPRVPD